MNKMEVNKMPPQISYNQLMEVNKETKPYGECPFIQFWHNGHNLNIFMGVYNDDPWFFYSNFTLETAEKIKRWLGNEVEIRIITWEDLES